MKKHRISNIMNQHKNLSYATYAQRKPDSVLFVFVQHVFSKVQLMCGSFPLLAWEFRPAEMGRVLMVLAKS